MEDLSSNLPQENLRLACSNYASRMTVQLFDVQPRFPYSKIRIPRALGSGVLIQYDEHYIILTASHVLDSEYVQRYGLYTGHHKVGFVDLGDFSFVRTSFNIDRVTDDDIDIAILFLESEVGEKVQKVCGFEFAKSFVAEFDDGIVYPCAHFIHGFPVNLTKFSKREQHIEAASLSCFLPLYSAPTSIVSHALCYNDVKYLEVF